MPELESSAYGEDFLASAVEAAPDAVVIVDGEGIIVYANQQAVTMFGYVDESLPGHVIEDLLPDHLRTVHRAHRLRYRADPVKRPMGVGLRLSASRRDGSQFPVEISLSPLHTKQGTAFMAAVRDVTERIRAEDELRRVLHTLDATDDAVFIFDAESLRFSYVNQGAVRQVGYAADELTSMTFMHLNPELTEGALREMLDPLLADERASHSLQTMHLRKDGVEVPVEMVMQCAPVSHEGHRSVVALARDVTARLEAEEQLQKSQVALRQAEQIMAVADDRERIARDLHDTVIQRLFASGLQLQALVGLLDDELRPRIEGVVAELDNTIRDLRTAIFGLQVAPDRPAGFRGQLLDIVTESATNLGFEPRLEFDGPIETIDDAIRDQLLPTLREALTNVARHAKAQHARVAVTAGPEVVLMVIDDGVGVPDEVLGGHGVRNMAQRASKLGGRCKLTRADGEAGTRLIWSVPADPSDPTETDPV